MRFGIGGEAVHTLEEIGKGFHLSRERIRQIESALKNYGIPAEVEDCVLSWKTDPG